MERAECESVQLKRGPKHNQTYYVIQSEMQSNKKSNKKREMEKMEKIRLDRKNPIILGFVSV